MPNIKLLEMALPVAPLKIAAPLMQAGDGRRQMTYLSDSGRIR